MGGRWDRIDRQFVDGDFRVEVYEVNESQVEIVRAVADWLRRRLGGEDRPIVYFGGGARGGGKTDVFVALAAAILVAIPGAEAWVVNPNLDKRAEVERIFRRVVPRTWAQNPRVWPSKIPECRFRLLTGSSLKNLSGEVPDSVKRGGTEVIFLNEAQEQRKKVFSLGLPAIRDTGGVMLVAANPPQSHFPAGEWVLWLKNGIESRRVDGRYFEVEPSLNVNIHQQTLPKIAAALEVVDPEAATADAAGEWRPLGERAYPKFRPHDLRTLDGTVLAGMVREPPDLGDITAEALRRAGIYPSYPLVAGGDFQGRPHQAAIVLRVFGGRPDGKNVYWVVDEMIVEGTERHLSAEAYDRGYRPETLCWIPDASGEWQDARHTGRETSFDILRGDRWNLFPPTEVQRPDSTHAANPRVERRLSLMYQVMDEGRFFVAPNCVWLVEALEKCPLGAARYGGKKPYGKYAHACDAVGYPIWRLEPKPAQLGHVPSKGAMKSVEIKRDRGGWSY